MSRLLLSLFFPLVLLIVFYSVPAGLLAPQSRPALFPPGTPLSISPSWCDPYGITILLMGEDPELRFDRNLQDASRLGARWVQLSFPTYLRNHDSIELPVRDRRTPDLSTVQRSIMRAKSSGFKVALHPILLIQDPEDPGPGPQPGNDRTVWENRSRSRAESAVADIYKGKHI